MTCTLILACLNQPACLPPWKSIEHLGVDFRDEGSPNAGKGSGAPTASYPTNGYGDDVVPEAKSSREKAATEQNRNAWPNPFIITT